MNTKVRMCLKCKVIFLSELDNDGFALNRICPKCNIANKKVKMNYSFIRSSKSTIKSSEY